VPSVSAQDVAAELRLLLPGLPVKKLHKLLYYAQGHHLAHFGTPLFSEPVMAWDMGPVVANLWKAEQESRSLGAPLPLDEGQLNTVAYVVSRYGGLTGSDLERLTHAEQPWMTADASREPQGSVRIELDVIREFFVSAGGPDPELPWPSAEDVMKLVQGAEQRRSAPARRDDLALLRAKRLAG
jgi:uncharacterized phage-associated protein